MLRSLLDLGPWLTCLAIKVQSFRHVGPSSSSELPDVDGRIVDLLSRGATGAEVADALHMSVRTVHNRLSRMFKRHGVRGQTELIAFALRRGYID